MIHHISQLQEEQKLATSKVKHAKEKLSQAMAAKTEGIEVSKRTNERETNKSLEDLEVKMRKEQENKYKKAEEKITEQVKLEYEQKFEEEREKKRKREQEEEEAREKEESENRLKWQKVEKEKAGKGDGGAAEATNEEGQTEEEDERETKIKELEKKRKEIQVKLEKLSEEKSEMFWLLKQVIMQETKQKMQLMKQKKLEAARVSQS
jgi:hypothetical protein